MKPLNTYILVKKLDDECKIGNLYIPNADSNVKVRQGIVMEVNSKCTELAVGDKIIYNKFAEHPTGSEDKSVILVRIEDIEAICE